MTSQQDRRYSLRRFAPLAVSMLALFVALGGWGHAATGGSFVLGKLNSANSPTRLRSSGAQGPTLVIRNTSARPAASFIVGQQIAPFKVNSSTRVAGLNADLLDGIDAADFYAKGSKVSDSDLLDGLDSAALQRRITSLLTNASGQITSLEAAGAGAIPLLGTSTDQTRAIVGRLGVISCAGTYAVGGCAGNSGRGVYGQGTIGVIGDSSARGVVGTLGGTSCAGTYAVGGCGANLGVGVVGNSAVSHGVVGVSSVAPNATGAAVYARNTVGGDIFIGETGTGARQARINGLGRGFFNGGTQTGGADFAESIPAVNASQLEPGDVLTIDPRRRYVVRKSAEPHSRLVAGVYSTKPAVLAVGRHRIGDARKGEVPVALVGIVPTKVTAAGGAIRAGDLLTTSSLPGHAMKASPVIVRGVRIYPTGAILGKALEPLRKGTGVIKVMLMWR